MRLALVEGRLPGSRLLAVMAAVSLLLALSVIKAPEARADSVWAVGDRIIINVQTGGRTTLITRDGLARSIFRRVRRLIMITVAGALRPGRRGITPRRKRVARCSTTSTAGSAQATTSAGRSRLSVRVTRRLACVCGCRSGESRMRPVELAAC